MSYWPLRVPWPVTVLQLLVVPTLPGSSTGAILVTHTLNAPTEAAVLPAETWICKSNGVPAVPTVFAQVGGTGVSAQLGHSASVKHTRPLHPLVNAATETNGETMFAVFVL